MLVEHLTMVRDGSNSGVLIFEGVSLNGMKGQKGYTLSELVTGLGIFSILILIASVLSSWAISRYYSVRDRLLAESVSYKAETLFRNVYGQAIDVEFDNGIVPATLGGLSGRIHHTSLTGPTSAEFSFEQLSAASDWTRVSLFYREQATGLTGGATPTAVGDVRRTAVFYREPTATTSGVIFFNLSSPATSSADMQPTYDEAFVERVSAFGITKQRHPFQNKTTSIEVLIRIRYFMYPNGGQNWCPQPDIAAGAGSCALQTAWRDLERRFNVLLANNLIKAEGSFTHSTVLGEERTLGNLYFFRLSLPMRYQ